MPVPDDRSRLYVGADGFVDVAKLAAAYSPEEHKARADAYVKSIVAPGPTSCASHFTCCTRRRSPSDARRNIGDHFNRAHPAGRCGSGFRLRDGLAHHRPLTDALPAHRSSTSQLRRFGFARECAAANPALQASPPRFEVTGETLPGRWLSRQSHPVLTPSTTFGSRRRWSSSPACSALAAWLCSMNRAGHSHRRLAEGNREFAVIENDVVVETLWPAAELPASRN